MSDSYPELYAELRPKSKIAEELADILNCRVDEVPDKVKALTGKIERLEQELADVRES